MLTGGQTITLTNDAQHGTLTLAASVTMKGPTSGTGVTVDGGCTFNGTICTASGVTVFTVNGVTASLSNLTIQHGNSGNNGYHGGGISNNGGTLTVTNSTISGNSATVGGGGGIFNDGAR